MKVVASIVDTNYAHQYSLAREEIVDLTCSLLPFLPYTQENLEFLTNISQEYIENLKEFKKANIFLCQRCGNEAAKLSPCRENILKNCVPPPNFEG